MVKGFFRIISALFSFLFVLLLICIGAVFFANAIPDNGDFFSVLASALLVKPTTIQSAHFDLFSRYPSMTLYQVAIESDENNTLSLSTLQLTLNLSKSIEEKKLVFENIFLDGLALHVLRNNSDNKHTLQNAHRSLATLADWLVLQKNIVLRNANVNFCRSEYRCYAIKNINFTSSITAKKSIFATGSAMVNGAKINNVRATITDLHQPKAMVTGNIKTRLLPGVLDFSVHADKKQIHLNVKNKDVMGFAIIPTRKNKPVQIHLQRLLIHTQSSAKKLHIKINPARIPSLKIFIADLQIDNAYFSHLKIQTKPVQRGMLITDIHTDNPLAILSAHGSWLQRGKITETTLSGNLKSENLGALLEKRHFTSRLVGGVYDSRFAFRWPNSPVAFSTKTVRGVMQIDLQHARILNDTTEKNKQSSALPLGDILNLISLQSFSRLLTLDFRPKKEEPGFPFDYLKGSMRIQDGLVTSHDLEMDGPAAKIIFSGTIDLINSRNHLIMYVSPHFAKNKFSISGLPLGPILNLPIWLGKKMVSPIVNPFLKRKYLVTGTLNNPVMQRM